MHCSRLSLQPMGREFCKFKTGFTESQKADSARGRQPWNFDFLQLMLNAHCTIPAISCNYSLSLNSSISSNMYLLPTDRSTQVADNRHRRGGQGAQPVAEGDRRPLRLCARRALKRHEQGIIMIIMKQSMQSN